MGRYERAMQHPEWVPASQALTRICNAWAGRKDLVVYVGPDGGGRASAFYNPASGEIEVKSTDAFAGLDGSTVTIDTRADLAQYPVAGGLSMHESGHARYSPSLTGVREQFDSDAAYTVYVWLDETRIEGRMVARWPLDRGYLRASAHDLLVEDFTVSKPSARFAAVLLIGRAEVQALAEDDVTGIEQWLLSQDGWTSEILEEVRGIVTENMLLEKSEQERMIKLAKLLDSVMPPDPDSDPEDGDLPGLIASALGRALREGASEVIEAADEIAQEEAQSAREESARTENRNKSEAASVFLNGMKNYTPSQLSKTRPPTTEEIAASVTLSRELELARYRERVLIEWEDVVPPGRLNTGEAMRRAAAISKGGASERYRPFTHSRRDETDEAKLSVGIMSDVSGSMSSLQPAVGSAVWIVADAVYRLKDANAAAVYFGDKAYPGLRVGDRPANVSVWSGGGGYEHFDGGFRALDGALTLLNGTGARVLVVVSDGAYKDDQNTSRDKWIKACTQNGVAVVWLALNGRANVEPVKGLEIVSVTTGVLDMATVVGKACVKALKDVSR